MIQILNLKKSQPTEVYDFKIDRSSPIGNPFTINSLNNRENVIKKYSSYFNEMLNDENNILFNIYVNVMIEAFKKYGKLRLFCWCAPKKCHGEIIKNYIEQNYGQFKL